MARKKKKSYEEWKAALPPNLRNSDPAHYDLRKAYEESPEVSSDMHLSDVGKRPKHITFSNESAYSKNEGDSYGGKWGKDYFQPSPENLKNNSLKDLQGYLKNYDKGYGIRSMSEPEKMKSFKLSRKWRQASGKKD